MNRRLLNHTSSVPVERTIAEIQAALVQAKASSILTEFEEGELRAVMFKIHTAHGELPFKLPAKVEEAYQVMYGHQPHHMVQRYGVQWREQAKRTAWRILLTWVKAQISIIELDMAKPEEVFLPYLLVREDTTLFEDAQAKHFLLGGGAAQKEGVRI